MKLPQYRLLKISSDRKGTSIKAEWVDFFTCEECKKWHNGWCYKHGRAFEPYDFCSYGQKGDENVKTD